MSNYLFTSNRLGFRTWKESDINPLFEMCQDERVMEFFPNTIEMPRIVNSIERFNNIQKHHGFTFWGVDVLTTNKFIGFIGLAPVTDLYFAPAVEIGWRLIYDEWNKGYATEGARACIEYGFTKLNINKIVSFTAEPNKRSEAVMKKIGMKKVDEFGHPKLAKDHWLYQHVLYEIKNEN